MLKCIHSIRKLIRFNILINFTTLVQGLLVYITCNHELITLTSFRVHCKTIKHMQCPMHGCLKIILYL